MTPASVHDVRNIALLGHAGCGKTSLVEALLAAAGEIGAPGSVERGTTQTDFDPLEREMGHSLSAAVVHLERDGHWINLIDTPGLPDLAGRALSALGAADTGAVLIDASSGIESVTRRMMAASVDKCRLIIVSKIDAAGWDAAALIDDIARSFGRECLPINLPSADGARVVDCFFAPDYDAATACSSVREAHDTLVDQVVELDEELMAAYLEQGETLDPQQLHDPFERALREGHLVPVCFTSARSGAGVQELLDIVARLMPDPTEGNPPRFSDGEDATARPVDVVPDPDRHVVAHVFAIANDPFRGKLALLRIHQGRITPNTQLYIGDARKSFRVAHLLRPQGRNQVETPAGVPGDLCALARIDEIRLGDVLHDSHDEDALHLVHPPYPQPVFGLALIPHKHGDEQKLSEALARLVDEDPCVETGFDAQSRHLVVRGLGEMHLRIVQAQLRSRWNLQFDTAPPAVPYRETIAGSGEARHRHKKQSGGAGQFGEVALRVEALPRGAGIELGSEVKGGAIPTNFLPAVEKGVRQALDEGALAGFPVQDVRVVLVDGKHHPVDSNEISFVTAGRAATIEALLTARPILLEPQVEIALDIDEQHFGEVSAEFSARRGRITGTEVAADGLTRLVAAMPLAELDGFEARLKAILAGSSTFTLSAAGFEPAPPDVQKKLASARGNGG